MEIAESVSYWVRSYVLHKMQFNKTELNNVFNIKHRTSPLADWDTAIMFCPLEHVFWQYSQVLCKK